jgi:hypothetical protein
MSHEMTDEELVSQLGPVLKSLYYEPTGVRLAASVALPPVRSSRAWLLAVASLIVIAALGLALARGDGKDHAGPASPTAPTALPTPTATAVIEAGRLAAPFSIAGGQSQLSAPGAGYRPKVTSQQAAKELENLGDRAADGSAPTLFLANLTDYSTSTAVDPKTHALIPSVRARPVWVSLDYVEQRPYGGVGESAPRPKALAAELITIDADTGHIVSGIDIAAPDPVAITTARIP